MQYTDKQKEHIRHCFDCYCKKTIRYQAISLYQESSKYAERNDSFLLPYYHSPKAGGFLFGKFH